MKIVYVKAPYNFIIKEKNIPDINETQVLIDIRACAVCGSDIHMAQTDAVQYQAFGHEIAGKVIKCGKSVHRIAPGDHVVIESSTPCHTCDRCRNGRPDLCVNPYSFMDIADSGGYADYIAVEERSVLPYSCLSYVQASLTEPLGVALDLLHTADIRLGDNVAVIGLGPIGLMEIALARQAGASRIIALQRDRRSTARINLADKLGVEKFFFSAEQDVSQMDFSNYDINKILVTASPSVLPLSFRMAAFGGIISYIGFDTSNHHVTFDADCFHVKKLQLRASFAKPALYFPEALELLQKNIISADDFITQQFAISDLPEFFRKQESDKKGIVKMVMVK